MAKLKHLSVWHKAITISSLAFGLGLNVATVKSIPINLSYFTTQSNILCLIIFIIFIVLEIAGQKKTKAYYVVKGGGTMAIFITALLYNCGMAFGGFKLGDEPVEIIRTVFLHMISPTLVILDYFLYEEKGKLKKSYPLLWVPFTAYYLIYAYVYANFGERFRGQAASGKFAYFFLDYEKFGYFKVFLWLMLLLIVFLAVAYGIVLYDNSKREEKESD